MLVRAIIAAGFFSLLCADAGATMRLATESILPPGMRSLTVTLDRDPDVRCVVPNCFTPPVRRREESQRSFERRLLSPRGKGRLE